MNQISQYITRHDTQESNNGVRLVNSSSSSSSSNMTSPRIRWVTLLTFHFLCFMISELIISNPHFFILCSVCSVHIVFQDQENSLVTDTKHRKLRKSDFSPIEVNLKSNIRHSLVRKSNLIGTSLKMEL